MNYLLSPVIETEEAESHLQVHDIKSFLYGSNWQLTPCMLDVLNVLLTMTENFIVLKKHV